jgi:hypothetical protein
MARQLHPQNLSTLNLKIPEKSPDFCYSWLNLLQICETTKPPESITKAALILSKWLFDIQQNNPSYKQRVQDIKLVRVAGKT